MAEKLLMLALSPTMEEGVIVKWVKQVGDAVSSGEALCEVETDKAIMEYQALDEGVLLQITAGEGASAKVGDMIGIIGKAGEDFSDLLKEAAKESKSKAAKEPQAEVEKEATAEAEKAPKAEAAVEAEAKKEAAVMGGIPKAESGRDAPAGIRSSPLARKLAEKHGVDLGLVQGSGPLGRIVERDIQQYLEGSGASSAAGGEQVTESIKVSDKRRMIAQRLSESKFSAPHYYLKISVLVDGLLNERKRFNKNSEQKISFNSYLMKISAETIKKHPRVNATWQGDTIGMRSQVDIALAVAQPDGLITPVVRDCGVKGIVAIDRELKVLIDKARKGALTPPEYSNSTFTITNLGGFGIDEFTAIINPPNSAILAVGAALKQPVVGDEGGIEVRTVMKLTLSCDHRLIDGVVGAMFLSDLKYRIEYPIAGWY